MKVVVSIETEDGKTKVFSEPISIRILNTGNTKGFFNDESIKELTDIFCGQIKENFPNLLRQYKEKKDA